ncbi:MAG: sugar phosphate isomerase/epimerase family protein [Thermomicrobiales bacterium]
MQLGCCVTPDRVAALAGAGGDYVELTVASTVMGGDDAVFARLRADAASWGPRPRAYSVLLPGDLKVTGPATDRSKQETYLRTAFARIHQLSGPGAVVVFGSGRSRAIPDGFSRDAALDQLADFMTLTGALAHEQGITMALEPLRRGETNVFNDVRESGAFLRQRQIPNFLLLADLYHMMEENEPLSAIDEYADLIVHTHVADSGRAAPGTGTYPIAEFFQKLRANNYQGKCSIECRWDDFTAQIGPAMAAVRDAARSAGW